MKVDGRQSEEKSVPVRLWVLKLAGMALLACLLIGSLPAFVHKFGFPYLPASTWFLWVKPYAQLSGTVAAVLFFCVMAKGLKKTDPVNGSAVISLFLLAGAPVAAFLLVFQLVVSGGPIILAIVAGQQVELHYSVVDADSSSDSTCRQPIELAGMPWLFRDLCGFPGDFRDTLTKGTAIVVSGHGTRFGLFPNGARVLE